MEIDKTNLLGSGISIGHPIGCTGARIVVTLMKINPEDYNIPAEYRHWHGDKAEDFLGPFFFRAEAHVVSEEGLNAYGALTWGQFFVYQGFNEEGFAPDLEHLAPAVVEYRLQTEPWIFVSVTTMTSISAPSPLAH